MHGHRGRELPDPAASLERQFHGHRGDALCRSYRTCAVAHAGASDRPVLVSGAGAHDLAGGPGLAPFLPRTVPARFSLIRKADRRTPLARRRRAGFLSAAARAGAKNRRGPPHCRQFRQGQLRPLDARYRAAHRPRRPIQNADADLGAETVAAGGGGETRGSGRTHSRAPARTGLSGTRDRQQPAQRGGQSERAP